MSRISEAMRRASGPRTPVRAAATAKPSFTAELADYPRETAAVQSAPAVLTPRAVVPRPAELERPSIVALPDALVSPQPFVAPRWAEPEPLVESTDSVTARGPFHRIAGALMDIQSRSIWPGAEDRQLRTLLVTSATSGEGRTLTVVNLARSLSEDYGQRVLIIDADLRRPAVHDLLGVSNVSGLTDILHSGGREVSIHRVDSRLFVLPAGSRTPSAFPSELFTESTCEVLRECASKFDWVLLDGPPVSSSPEATRVMARFARAVLFVIASGRTPHRSVSRAISEIGRASIVGTVFNSGYP